jgi:hypothetical protein
MDYGRMDFGESQALGRASTFDLYFNYRSLDTLIMPTHSRREAIWNEWVAKIIHRKWA